MKERIQKVLAAAGVASRRAIESMVREGRVSVNGQTVIDLPVMVDPVHDKIAVDGENVRVSRRVDAERIYILMNKPPGVYTTNVAQGEQLRAVDLLPPGFPYRLYPVGRLDADARGLLLLTNDGDLTNRLTHPRYGVSKTYRAVVAGYIEPADVEQLQKGIWLSDPKRGGGFKTSHSRIHIISRGRERSILEITVREGRDLQVRRMLARVGHKVKELTRIKMGPLELKGIGPGESRALTPREVSALRTATQPRESKPSAGVDEAAASETTSHRSDRPAAHAKRRPQYDKPSHGKPAHGKPAHGKPPRGKFPRR